MLILTAQQIVIVCNALFYMLSLQYAKGNKTYICYSSVHIDLSYIAIQQHMCYLIRFSSCATEWVSSFLCKGMQKAHMLCVIFFSAQRREEGRLACSATAHLFLCVISSQLNGIS